jgi:predicted flap endonuclease-1-like 5' DNA nuclease
MTFALDFVALAWAVSGIVVGLLLGNLIWGRAARRHKRVADSVASAAAAAAARTQAEAAQRELAAAQAAMRPLADEVDRLKRELAKAKRPVQAPLPLEPLAAPVADAAVHVVPTEAIAGTGPIVAGDGAVPDIRQLKGVGDRFAVALDGIGLGSVDALARLNADEAAEADTRLGTFNGRIARDRLVEQCVLLDEGRMTEYEATFGKLGGPILV